MLHVLCSQEGDAPKNTAGMLRARVPPVPCSPFPTPCHKKRVGEDAASVPTQPRAQLAWVASPSPARGGSQGNASCPAG